MLQALQRLLNDKEDTGQVFEIMRALNWTATATGYQRLLTIVQGGRIAYEREELAVRLMDDAWLDSFKDGSVGAILFWFDLRLDADTVLSNAPDGDDALHWKQGLQFLPEARIAAGQTLPLVAHHNGSALRLQWRAEGLPTDAFSRMPRFDPRWLAASTELEQQTRNLLQHCAQHPDEFAKVARIAQRMAVDPARHDLDPVIAQRFMSMFFAG